MDVVAMRIVRQQVALLVEVTRNLCMAISQLSERVDNDARKDRQQHLNAYRQERHRKELHEPLHEAAIEEAGRCLEVEILVDAIPRKPSIQVADSAIQKSCALSSHVLVPEELESDHCINIHSQNDDESSLTKLPQIQRCRFQQHPRRLSTKKLQDVHHKEEGRENVASDRKYQQNRLDHYLFPLRRSAKNKDESKSIANCMK
mmetsp:Transcript_122716/g.306474  ORF Transcript_122716/g.306474 Transcript_122716/m.306474 type:complete len:203 (-) Transcript_122716:465-1073(-)